VTSAAERDALLELAASTETPSPELCLKIARASLTLEDYGTGYAWLARATDSPGPFVAWASAAGLLAELEGAGPPTRRREARVSLAGSYTTSQLGPLLRLAAFRRGIRLELYETGFDAYTQEIFDRSSGLYAFEPDYVILAPHEGAVRFPSLAEDPARALDDEAARWEGLWEALHEWSCARVMQHTFAIRPETAWGHVAGRVPGSRDELLRALNARLAEAAGDRVLIVDCDRIAAAFGKRGWFDDRYWHLAKQAVALDALPELARHTAAVLAAAEGLSAKCVVLDLDNTLWGGVVAEDGLAGIALGGTPQGEAHVAFQEYLLALRARGILLAVVSKNNSADAKEPFESHPDMRLRLSHFAAFFANWEDKPTNLRRVAEELDIGLDSLVFVDDNPAEREAIRQVVPEVEVVTLPKDPSGYVRALSDSLFFEAASLTSADLAPAGQYAARSTVARLEQNAGSLENFYASLGMEAFVAPFDELNLPRIAQLIGKTNQFNVTTRRHGLNAVRAFMDDPRTVTLYLRLRDHFVDHGLVAVLIAREEDGLLDIDTWLMSCRVIGRTVEDELLMRLCTLAQERGCSRLRGTFIPTAKNSVVHDLFERFGFELVGEKDGLTTWVYDIAEKGVVKSEFISAWSDAAVHA